ncbi:MAG: aminodeoxychorismate synthase component I [Porticoccaceae bacterium]
MTQPILQEIPFSADSERLFARLRHLPGAVWLDSGKPRSLQGRFDIISALPEITLLHREGKTHLFEGAGSTREIDGDPFHAAWNLLVEQGLVGNEFHHIPFTGGLIGYCSYDVGRTLHELPPRPRHNVLPAMHLGWYGWALIINHSSSKSWLVSHPACNPDSLRLVREILSAAPDSTRVADAEFSLQTAFSADVDKPAYLDAINRIHDYIRAGDCYQVNYALRHRARFQGDPWQAYRLLRRASPSPYSAYLAWQDCTVLSCSPERFLKVSVGQVETKPIKGTIARGATLQSDQENAICLLNSKKDRAENLMIVDMLRNDLSRNCAVGSVRVPKLFALESFANVHHLVSTVTGTLAPGKNALDLLRDAFPGGSITGAPKKRAMEIIDELEGVDRGLYCGSIGYISATGRMDTNIAIRTLMARDGTLECWGGGGIVADSDPEREYEEALQKVRNLMRALEHPESLSDALAH